MIDRFFIYLTMLYKLQDIRRQWMLNKEKIIKKVLMAYWKVFYYFLPRETEENHREHSQDRK